MLGLGPQARLLTSLSGRRTLRANGLDHEGGRDHAGQGPALHGTVAGIVDDHLGYQQVGAVEAECRDVGGHDVEGVLGGFRQVDDLDHRVVDAGHELVDHHHAVRRAARTAEVGDPAAADDGELPRVREQDDGLPGQVDQVGTLHCYSS
jgi:hypothetical protein